jgi:tRNA dimethylallyltransferase
LDTGEADPELRAELERQHKKALVAGDPERLHRGLSELDPEAAARIHPNDVRRIIRALEIGQHSGKPASRLRSGHDFGDRPYRTLHLALDPGRETLNERIDRRCAEMIEGGLLQEARSLQDRGYGPELRSMQAIGYRHVMPVVAGVDTLANALEVMRRDTRRFARRQRTWLRKVSAVRWLHPDSNDELLATVEAFLSGAVEQPEL